MNTNKPMTREQLDAIQKQVDATTKELWNPERLRMFANRDGATAGLPPQPETRTTMSTNESEMGMAERTYTREDMARAWDEGRESGTTATMLNLSYGAIHQPANPYREQEEV